MTWIASEPGFSLKLRNAGVNLLRKLLRALGSADVEENAGENSSGNRDREPDHDRTEIDDARAEEILVSKNRGQDGGDNDKKGNERRRLRLERF